MYIAKNRPKAADATNLLIGHGDAFPLILSSTPLEISMRKSQYPFLLASAPKWIVWLIPEPALKEVDAGLLKG